VLPSLPLHCFRLLHCVLLFDLNLVCVLQVLQHETSVRCAAWRNASAIGAETDAETDARSVGTTGARSVAIEFSQEIDAAAFEYTRHY